MCGAYIATLLGGSTMRAPGPGSWPRVVSVTACTVLFAGFVVSDVRPDSWTNGFVTRFREAAAAVTSRSVSGTVLPLGVELELRTAMLTCRPSTSAPGLTLLTQFGHPVTQRGTLE
jgi:hypothetical protein